MIIYGKETNPTKPTKVFTNKPTHQQISPPGILARWGRGLGWACLGCREREGEGAQVAPGWVLLVGVRVVVFERFEKRLELFDDFVAKPVHGRFELLWDGY